MEPSIISFCQRVSVKKKIKNKRPQILSSNLRSMLQSSKGFFTSELSVFKALTWTMNLHIRDIECRIPHTSFTSEPTLFHRKQ